MARSRLGHGFKCCKEASSSSVSASASGSASGSVSGSVSGSASSGSVIGSSGPSGPVQECGCCYFFQSQSGRDGGGWCDDPPDSNQCGCVEFTNYPDSVCEGQTWSLTFCINITQACQSELNGVRIDLPPCWIVTNSGGGSIDQFGVQWSNVSLVQCFTISGIINGACCNETTDGSLHLIDGYVTNIQIERGVSLEYKCICINCAVLDAPDCTNCADCPVDTSDPQFPVFTICADQSDAIGPTYLCIDKDVICTGNTFTVTFNILNLTGSIWESLPPNSPPPLSGPDAYIYLDIGAYGLNQPCWELSYVSSNRQPFSVCPTQAGLPCLVNSSNIINVAWLISIANGQEQVFSATFKMHGNCNCQTNPTPFQTDILITAWAVRGCHCGTCYRCSSCEEATQGGGNFGQIPASLTSEDNKNTFGFLASRMISTGSGSISSISSFSLTLNSEKCCDGACVVDCENGQVIRTIFDDCAGRVSDNKEPCSCQSDFDPNVCYEKPNGPLIIKCGFKDENLEYTLCEDS